jgi:hypothetical protein
MKTLDLGPLQMALFPAEAARSASTSLYKPSSEAGPLVYLAAGPDLAVVLARVEKAGGKVTVQKRQISPDTATWRSSWTARATAWRSTRWPDAWRSRPSRPGPRSRKATAAHPRARFRGRGMPTSRYDVWMANLGPSEKLLRAIHDGKVSWSEFAKQYRAELFLGGAIESRNATIRTTGRSSPCASSRSSPAPATSPSSAIARRRSAIATATFSRR